MTQSVKAGGKQVLNGPAVVWTCQVPEQGCEGHQQGSLSTSLAALSNELYLNNVSFNLQGDVSF